MRKNYSSQLKDPRWQKKRLELLEKAGWKCSQCGSVTKQLHVHHHGYCEGLDYWDYPENSMSVVCDDCHKMWHDMVSDSRKKVQMWFSADQEFAVFCSCIISIYTQAIRDGAWTLDLLETAQKFEDMLRLDDGK